MCRFHLLSNLNVFSGKTAVWKQRQPSIGACSGRNAFVRGVVRIFCCLLLWVSLDETITGETNTLSTTAEAVTRCQPYVMLRKRTFAWHSMMLFIWVISPLDFPPTQRWGAAVIVAARWNGAPCWFVCVLTIIVNVSALPPAHASINSDLQKGYLKYPHILLNSFLQ